MERNDDKKQGGFQRQEKKRRWSGFPIWVWLVLLVVVVAVYVVISLKYPQS